MRKNLSMSETATTLKQQMKISFWLEIRNNASKTNLNTIRSINDYAKKTNSHQLLLYRQDDVIDDSNNKTARADLFQNTKEVQPGKRIE